MLSLEELKKEIDLINEISWDLGPEEAVKLYLEWGNTDWGSGKQIIRSKDDYSTYFVVNCWRKPFYIYLIRRNSEEALELAEKLPYQPSAQTSGVMRYQIEALAYDAMGQTEESNAVMDRYIREHGDQYPTDIAQVYVLLGDKDEAFAWMRRGLEANRNFFRDQIRDPVFKSLHDDPRWAELQAELEAE